MRVWGFYSVDPLLPDAVRSRKGGVSGGGAVGVPGV